MNKRQSLVKSFVKHLISGNASLFVGAGLSVGSGLVDWKTLLQQEASELGLGDFQCDDPIDIAQWYVNERGGRGGLTQHICEHFQDSGELTENHEVIARLPLKSIWTTNYDKLLEQAFSKIDKTCDVKRQDSQLVFSNPNSEVTLYKMHGDIENPIDIVLITEDYDRYDTKYQTMSNLFYTSLTQYQFLFIGFSFRDPNLRRILGRVALRFSENQREHYAIMRRPSEEDERRRFDYFISDLQRYNIQVCPIDDYDEITDILKEILDTYHSEYGSELIKGQAERNRVIIRKLEEITISQEEGLHIYNQSVFSIFAVPDDPDDEFYKKLEHDEGNPEHMSQLRLEKKLLDDLMSFSNTTFRLLLWPPPPEFPEEYEKRYATLIRWIEQKIRNPNLEVRCTSFYRPNRLIVPGHFCIEAAYSPKHGYDMNKVLYHSRRNEEMKDMVDDFNFIFENRTKIASSKEAALEFLDQKRQECMQLLSD